MTKQLKVGVGTLESSLAHFKKAWEDVTSSKHTEPEDVLHFENATLLLKTLTAQRLLLLQQVHALGTCSIRRLAKALHRDYKNVHTDVMHLWKVGLLEKMDGQYTVPWDKITTEIPMIDKAA